MGENSWDHELSLFADDLFADLMSRHPSLRTLPRKYGGSRYFTDKIGKCVMLIWHDIRHVLDRKLRSDFPRFVKSENSFKRYLKVFVDLQTQTQHNVINRILGISAILFEIVCFVYRRGMAYYFGDASKYLFFVLLGIKTEGFYEEGVWYRLASVSAKLTEGYNEDEICRQYLLENVCNFNPSISTTTSQINLTLKNSTETSGGIGGKNFQGKIPGEDSAKEHDSALKEASTEIKIQITNHSPKIPSKEPSVMLIPESAVSELQNSVVDSAKSNEYLVVPKQCLLPQTEASQVASESVEEFEEPSRDSNKTSLKLEASQTKLESFEESTGRIMPDNGEPSMGKLRKLSTECIKNSTEDFVDPIDCLHESFQAETSPTDSDSSKEMQKDTEAILSNFQVPVITKREEMEYFSRETLESTAKSSCPFASPLDEANNTTDKPKTNPMNSTKRKDTDAPILKGDGGIQTALESVNNHQKSTEKNLENAETLPTEISSCTELCANDNSKKNDSSLFKSPKLETCKKPTPVKAKTPSSEKRGIADVKSKTATPKGDRKVTPIKTPTSGAPKSSSLFASTGRNTTETQTPKTLKQDSVKSKPKSPAFAKTHTDRGLSSVELKSSEKTDKSRRLSLPKSPPGIRKNSPRSISASAAKTKSCTKDLSLTDSFKPSLTAVEKSKLGAKELFSKQFKSSSSTTSASVSKLKVTAKDTPIACEKSKSNLQSSNPKIENVKECILSEKAVGSCSAKSTDASECIPGKTSEEPFDTRSEAEETSHQTQKCEETKGKKKPIASARNANCSSGRTRSAPGKHPSMESKNEKPRWR